MPSHVILFDSLKSKISIFLSNYKEIHSFFHTDVSHLVEDYKKQNMEIK